MDAVASAVGSRDVGSWMMPIIAFDLAGAEVGFAAVVGATVGATPVVGGDVGATAVGVLQAANSPRLTTPT
jgi:hypothetical protein